MCEILTTSIKTCKITMSRNTYKEDFKFLSELHKLGIAAQSELESDLLNTLSSLEGHVKVAQTLKNGWIHHQTFESTAELRRGEQVLLTSRFLRTASVTKEKMICLVTRFCFWIQYTFNIPCKSRLVKSRKTKGNNG
ncbi:hypothetical protein ANCDUO_05358 [Ancylostoma duodenale]|uniref:Uncharacterized protein n=1 Tax=Ancylostoma duodenale TaxID=51022 RepID=A0A0C2H4N2_9BILA|nr:hypothetical protein ANCDUO_05358 [Ancylostoma duodenale]